MNNDSVTWLDTETGCTWYKWDGKSEIRAYCRKELLAVFHVPSKTEKTPQAIETLIKAYKIVLFY